MAAPIICSSIDSQNRALKAEAKKKANYLQDLLLPSDSATVRVIGLATKPEQRNDLGMFVGCWSNADVAELQAATEHFSMVEIKLWKHAT